MLSSFKSAKFFKIFTSTGSILLTMKSYAIFYGWRYAIGFVSLILCHEMGHYVAAKRKNLNVGLPIFIPFVGAWVELKEKPLNVETEAYIAYAGPLIGTLFSFIFYYLGRHFDSGLCIALAHAGFVINLFNLIPIAPLDGGRITSVLSPRFWLIGVPLLIGICIYYPNSMLILISLFALPQLIKSWKFDPTILENKSYYDIKPVVRFEYALIYLVLVIVLALMVQKLSY